MNTKIRFNRIDIKEAYWCLARFVCGQLASYEIYTRLVFVGYGLPRPALYEGPKHLSKNGKLIYMNLVRVHYA